MTKMETMTGIVAAMGQHGVPVIGICAQVRLGSGEVVESPIMRRIDVTTALEEPVS
jgi:glycerate kinase